MTFTPKMYAFCYWRSILYLASNPPLLSGRFNGRSTTLLSNPPFAKWRLNNISVVSLSIQSYDKELGSTFCMGEKLMCYYVTEGIATFNNGVREVYRL